MKRKLLLTALLAVAFCTGNAYAQKPAARVVTDSMYYKRDTLIKVNYGVKLGADFNQITGDQTFKQGFTPGVAVGGFISSERKKIGIRAEAMISTVRYNLQNDSINHDAYFSNINANIAALFEFELVPKLWIQLGPQFSSFISISQHPQGSLDPHHYFSSKDFSGVAGLEVRLPSHFIAGARYLYGLSDLKSDISANVTSQDWNTRTIHVYVGYRLK